MNQQTSINQSQKISFRDAYNKFAVYLSQPSPSMNTDIVAIFDDYAAATSKAVQLYREQKRRVSVQKNLQVYFYIDYKGEWCDRGFCAYPTVETFGQVEEINPPEIKIGAVVTGAGMQGKVIEIWTGTEEIDGRFYMGKQLALVQWRGHTYPGRWSVDELRQVG